MRSLGNGQVICSLPWRTSGFRFWTGRVWVLPLCQPQGKYFLLRTGVSKERFIFILMFHFWSRVTSIMGQQATKLDAGKNFPEASRCAHQAHCIMVSVQRILGGRLRVKWAGGFTSVGTAKYSDLSGTHPGVWEWLCFYLHMEFWWLTHSLSRPVLQRSAGLPCGLCKPMLRSRGQPGGHGLGQLKPKACFVLHELNSQEGSLHVNIHKAPASVEDSNKRGRLSFLFRIPATSDKCLRNVPSSVKAKPGTQINKSLTWRTDFRGSLPG